MGAAIAYELSQIPQLEISVFDRQAPAQAATGAALGVLMAAISQKPKGNNLKMRLMGIQAYDQWIPQLEAVTSRKIPYNRQGILRLCFAGEDLERWRSLAAIRRSQGLQLELCDRAYLAANYPHLSLEQVIGAVYSPGDRQVDPTALTLALVAAAKLNGVTFHFNTPVIIDSPPIQGSKKLSRLDTPTETIALDWLIIAAGLGSTSLTTSLQQPVEIRPVLGQAVQIALEQPLGLPGHLPVITGNDVNLVPLGSGKYWIGATVEFGDAETQDFADLQPSGDRLEAMMHQAIALVPALENARIIQQWSGLRPRPEGRPAPIVELLSGYTNVILASGHYRNGVLLAPATANQVREIIQQGD